MNLSPRIDGQIITRARVLPGSLSAAACLDGLSFHAEIVSDYGAGEAGGVRPIRTTPTRSRPPLFLTCGVTKR